MAISNIVDVIIPVHNQFKVVQKCLTSVIDSASFNTYEIIVVDDASTELPLLKYLNTIAKTGLIKLFTNKPNVGFTGTVNFGMRLHPDRDVLLLNSDTVVHDKWLERMRTAAYSDDKVATVNPLTNASHISGYPYRESNDGIALEVNDEVLDGLAAKKNAGKYVNVHTTVGFCMYIKRECINNIGLFDVRRFPIGYGEESDFCYRARKVGWRHLVTGDVFVRHFENQSFGERKRKLVQEMIPKFTALHPDVARFDERFRRFDPLRGLRAGLDLARAGLLMSSHNSIRMDVVKDWEEVVKIKELITLVYCMKDNCAGLAVRVNHFPNLERYKMPKDIVKFNSVMRYLAVEEIRCRSVSDLSIFNKQVLALPIEEGLAPKLELAPPY